MSLACHFTGCTDPSGTSILCTFHRRNLTTYQAKKYMALLRELVIERDRQGNFFQCVHCEEMYTLEFATLEHFPYSRGARPDLKYDLKNCHLSCARCQVSNAPTRKRPSEFL